MFVIMKIDKNKIRKTIKAQGLTIGQAAEKMGVSRQGLHMILANESTLLKNVDKIAHGIGLKPKDILI